MKEKSFPGHANTQSRNNTSEQRYRIVVGVVIVLLFIAGAFVSSSTTVKILFVLAAILKVIDLIVHRNAIKKR